MMRDAKRDLSRGESNAGCVGRHFGDGDNAFWNEHLPELEGRFMEALSLYRRQILEELSKALVQVVAALPSSLHAHCPIPDVVALPRCRRPAPKLAPALACTLTHPL